MEELEETEEETGLSDYGTILGGYDTEGFLNRLFRESLEAVVSKKLLRDLSAILLTTVLCGAVRSLSRQTAERMDVPSLAAGAGILLLVSGSQGSLTALTEETILKLRDMANALLPVLGSAALLSGQVTAAAVKYTASAWFFELLVELCCGFVLPLIRLYLAASAAETVVGGSVMSAVLGVLRWCAVMALTGLMLAFTLYLSLSSMTANTVDAAVVRSAKTAVATLFPVVGSIAGDAASSLLSAAAVIRQSVGAFGLLAISAVLLAPFLQTGLRYLLFKGTALLSSELAEGRVPLLLRRLSEIMALLMACVGSCALALFFSVYSLIRTVSI